MKRHHAPRYGALEILRYIGPGFLVTVGFIDPGNWAANIAAGSLYGYSLLWMVTLSTIMLVVLQHNSAHLGIVTGLCLSEASTKFMGRWTGRAFLTSGLLACVATALAEVLGTAIGLQMLFGVPLAAGSIFTASVVIWMLLSNSYRGLERWIIGFVSLIGLSFIFELVLVSFHWQEALKYWAVPSFPAGSIPIIMSVLGAVVMPHNLFLHSEIIQSRQWNLEGEAVVKRQLKYEFTDTLSAMTVGWAINSAIIIVAASVFHAHGISVTDLSQAKETLSPLAGRASAAIFGLALVCAGFSSSITAAMAGGSICAGFFLEPFDVSDSHSRAGVITTILGALLVIFFISDAFKGLIWSQIALSIQLPWSIVALISLTSSQEVMGQFANGPWGKTALWLIAGIVSALNVLLLVQIA